MRFIYILFIALTLASCAHKETISSEVQIRKVSQSKYEIQIRKHVVGMGMLHQTFLTPYNFNSSYWIYVDSINGTIPAEKMVITVFWGCLENIWTTKGYIEFTDGGLIIALEKGCKCESTNTPIYEPLEINGTYRVPSNLQTDYKDDEDEIETELEAYSCDRAWMNLIKLDN